MRTLLTCSTYLMNKDQVWQFQTWLNLAEHLNRDVDYLIVDSGSTLFPTLPNWPIRLLNNDDEIPVMQGGIAKFRNALGHPMHDGLESHSGPCRAWMKGIEIAIASGYDRYIYYEMDLLFAKPVTWAFDQMTKPVGTGGQIPGQSFDEVGMFFAHVEYLWRSDFVAKYNWRGPTKPEGESRMMSILGTDRQVLPIRGNRDECRSTLEKLRADYPDGIDYITHATWEAQLEFLRMNGLEACWPQD